MIILLCDDDDLQLSWLEKNFLSINGFDTYTAHSADEAWGVFQTAPNIDAVITDYQCGGRRVRDGVELIQKIRRMNPSQQCILQTSEKRVLIPGVPQLHKPFGRGQLLRLLRHPVQPLPF